MSVEDAAAAFVVVDTSVLSYFTTNSPQAPTYTRLLSGRTIALSYFARTELENHPNWGEKRRKRLDALIAGTVQLPPSEATSTWSTSTWYGRASRKRAELGLHSVDDMDLWIISHAAEHRVEYMSHDRNGCLLARGLGLSVLTAHDLDPSE